MHANFRHVTKWNPTPDASIRNYTFCFWSEFQIPVHSENFLINSSKKKKRESLKWIFIYSAVILFLFGRYAFIPKVGSVGRQKTWYSGCRGNSGAHQTKRDNLFDIIYLGSCLDMDGKTCCQLCVAMFSDNRLDPTQNMFLLIWSFLWLFLIDGRQLCRVRK